MEDTLIINGITYIKQSQVAEMEQNLENIKKIVNSTLNDVSALISGQSIVQSNAEIEKPEKEAENPKITRDIALKIRQGVSIPYKFSRMDESGNFYSIHNRKYIFTMHDVLCIRKEFGVNTTNKDIKKLSERLSINENNVHRIIYNLEIGTFDKYIKIWLKSANDIKIKGNYPSFENNPQKRKESGMFV